MPTARQKTLEECATPQEALVELMSPFVGGASASPECELVAEGWASVDGDDIRLSREGLLRVDSLLPRFFEPEHRGIRYT